MRLIFGQRFLGLKGGRFRLHEDTTMWWRSIVGHLFDPRRYLELNTTKKVMDKFASNKSGLPEYEEEGFSGLVYAELG